MTANLRSRRHMSLCQLECGCQFVVLRSGLAKLPDCEVTVATAARQQYPSTQTIMLTAFGDEILGEQAEVGLVRLVLDALRVQAG